MAEGKAFSAANPLAQRLRQQLDAVVFDLGGTLIDYRGVAPSWPELEVPGIEACYAELAGHGLDIDPSEFQRRFIEAMDGAWRAATWGEASPPTLVGLLREVCGSAGFCTEPEIEEVAVRAYCEPIAAGAVPRTGARELVEWLHAAGFRLGLVSNTIWPAEAHLEDLERYGLLPHLEALSFSSEGGLWKPDPAVFQSVLAVLDVRPERAVFIGDRLAEDVAGAQRAGMRAVYLEGTTDYQEVRVEDFRPHARISSLPELPAALAELVARDADPKRQPRD